MREALPVDPCGVRCLRPWPILAVRYLISKNNLHTEALTHLAKRLNACRIQIGVDPMASTSQTSPNLTAPYVPFKSFMTALDYLHQGLPVILDRSVWPTFSGGLASQMLAAFRFLGLISEEYEASELLRRASDPDRRKEALSEAIRAGYRDLLELNVSTSTPKQLGEYLSEFYGVTGSTHKKAMTFFLHAAKHIDLPLSPSISRKTRSSGPRKRRQSNGTGSTPEATMPAFAAKIEPRKSASGSSKTIKLIGGGEATLSFDVDVWSMTPADQEFVFGMIRQMNEYEAKRSQPDSVQTETPEAGTSG